LTFEVYWPALFLLLVPVLWWVSMRTVTDQVRWHIHLSTAVRSMAVLMLSLALMQPVAHWRSADVSVIYLLDVSQSIALGSIEEAIAWIRQADMAGNPSHSQVIAFAAAPIVLGSPGSLEVSNVVSRLSEGSINRNVTNIESAIREAIPLFPSYHSKHLVLYSDGNENVGSLLKLIPRLKAESVRVHAVPSPNASIGDTWVEAIHAPSVVTSAETFLVQAEVFSQVETMADIELRYGDTLLGNQQVRLDAGVNRVGFDARVAVNSGAITLVATVAAPDDPFPRNNQYSTSVLVEARPTVLYVEGNAPSADYLRGALDAEGIRVSVISPEAFPSSVQALDSYNAVILSDIEGKSLSRGQMAAAATFLHDLGGGLIFAAGESVYGEDGYAGTVIEEALPVTFAARKPPESVAIVVVLDKSGSMEGQNLEMAKEATKAPLQFLKAVDQFGVVAFDKYHYWAVDLQPVIDPQKLALPISMIPAFGDTNAYPALKEAYLQLAESKAESKHVVLLSDGVSTPADFEQLTRQMADAGITVSTVAVGREADRELLRNIAVWGRGRAYFCEDPGEVPQVFVEESELATRKSLREGPFRPIVSKVTEAMKGVDLDSAPELRGYIVTTPRETSEVLLETHTGDPVLARWQYGLGKAVVFTSDVKNRWAADWIEWDGYPRFWAQLVRETMRRQGRDEFSMDVHRDGGFAQVRIEAIRDDGRFRNRMNPQLRVIAPDQSVQVVHVQQTGPGVYETRVALRQDGSYLFRAAADGVAGGASRVLTYSYPDEYHFYSPDMEKLRAVSSETGGASEPKVEDLFSPGEGTAAPPKDLWPLVAGLALVLYLGDVLLRRVRLFDSHRR
jgi:uncharacterized membrane protein